MVAARSSFKVRATVRNLTPAGTLRIDTGLGGWAYWWTLKAKHAHVRVHVTQVSEVDTYPATPCGAEVHWSAKRDRITASLPYSCAGSSPEYGVAVPGAQLRVHHAADQIGDYAPPPAHGLS